MPKVGLTHEAPMETRNAYTKVDVRLAVSVDGKELPSMATIGEALEEAVKVFSDKIKESYKVVPARVDTPVAEPYAPRA
jgi:hypothetical protein